MSCQEQQEEELEVLRSIYEGDDNFKEIDDKTFQYKYGGDGSYRSLVLEISWGDNYPEDPPKVNMETFYNKHILAPVKQKVVEGVLEQATDLLDTAMTYTLFEWVKENSEDLLAEQPETQPVSVQVESRDRTDSPDDIGKKKEKKEQMTKAQKRRYFDKHGNAEKQRGWDWVDVVKHLSQSGSQNK